jgi:acetolactate synthase-1/2/3 large subunit
LEPIVKWSSQATSSYTLYESVTRAFELAQRGPMGPIYLNVPIETMLADWTPPEKWRHPPPAPKTQPLPQDIDKIATLLVAVRNPVISTDSVGRDPQAVAALVELADLLAVPVFESRATQYANFPRSHKLHMGFNIEPHLKQTDLTLLVKSKVPWYPPNRYPTGGPIVAIDENPLKGHMVYQNLQADHYLEGDVATSLKLLSEAVRAKGLAGDRIAERRQRWQSEHEKLVAKLREAEAKARDATPIDPLWLLAALNEVMPDDTVYLDETIVHSPVLQQHLNWDKPQSYFYVPGGLGQGMATALGVKLALPKRPVVLCIGDGSFLYNPITQALGASRDNNLPIIVLVFNNSRYEAMKRNHQRYYPDGVAAGADLWHGVHIHGPDYAEMAKPFGFHGEKVEKPGELKAALLGALAATRNGKTAILNIALSG